MLPSQQNDQKQATSITDLAFLIGQLDIKVTNLSDDVKEIKQELRGHEENFVGQREFTQWKETEFKTLQKIVYGMVSLVLVAVVTALLAQVVK